jgi:hypothetical protein
VDDQRWEAAYRLSGERYLTSLCASQALAEQHLAHHRTAFKATDWRDAQVRSEQR